MSDLKQTPPTTANIPTSERVERLFMENNLLRVIGYLFCHDPRAAVAHIEPITDIDKIAKRQVTIEPHPSYGQPGPADFKVFLAILKNFPITAVPFRARYIFPNKNLLDLPTALGAARPARNLFIRCTHSHIHASPCRFIGMAKMNRRLPISAFRQSSPFNPEAAASRPAKLLSPSSFNEV